MIESRLPFCKMRMCSSSGWPRNSLMLTKLDGTAKGGIIAAIARTRPIPIRFIGVGEQLDDLRPFVAQEFVSALFD